MAGLVNRREQAIEWGDCDPAGIVYYPRYFAFFDNATAALFAAAGLPKHEMVRAHDIVGIPMVDTRATFSIPSRWGETILIESRIAAWRRSSFDVAHRVTKGEALAIEAWETRVWAGRDPEDPDRIRGKPIPDDVKARFGPAPPNAGPTAADPPRPIQARTCPTRARATRPRSA